MMDQEILRYWNMLSNKKVLIDVEDERLLVGANKWP